MGEYLVLDSDVQRISEVETVLDTEWANFVAVRALEEQVIRQGSSRRAGDYTEGSRREGLPEQVDTSFRWPVGNGVPPSGHPFAEHGKDERRIVGRANFYDFYLYCQDDNSRYDAVFGIVWDVERTFNEHVAGSITAVMGELRSNYYQHCRKDIQTYYNDAKLRGTGRGDTGHRDVIVSVDGGGNIFIDYFDPCHVKSSTYNIYAEKYDQDLEEIPEDEQAAAPEDRNDPPPEQNIDKENHWLTVTAGVKAEERGDAFDIDEFLEGLGDDEAFFGNNLTGNESGRGTRIFMLESDVQSIRRFGPIGKNGRPMGAHMQLVITAGFAEQITRRGEAQKRADNRQK